MSIRVAIRHSTEYEFKPSVELSPHIIRLKPAAHCRTPINSYSLHIRPKDHFINWQQDPFGNYLARVVFLKKTQRLLIDVEVIVEMVTINPFDFFVDEFAQRFPFEYPVSLKKALLPYLECNVITEPLARWLEAFERIPKERSIDFLVRLNQQLQQDIDYKIRMEPGVQTPEATLAKGSGSCRDSAWLLIHLLRHLGLAARFVSGYLVQLTPDQKPLEGPSGPEEDFTDLHAWAEVYLPGAGWVGLDPTSGLFAGEGHIPLACTPEPELAAPIEGSTDKCKVDFQFTNTLTRIYQSPRVTKPYSKSQWDDIASLGAHMDERCQRQDMRLTIGGEPTFVSAEDMEAAEWNTEALGHHKLERAKALIIGLRDQFTEGGLLHYGQGKWYPGEPLPRWALGCYWRTDGLPLWRNPKWQANISKPQGIQLDQVLRFARSFVEKAQCNPEHLQPAYEDPLHVLWEEQKQPINAELIRAPLDERLQREALFQKLSQGLNHPVGYVLPIEWNWFQGRWHSGRWQFRQPFLFLTEGNSPIGLRLPINSLPEPEFHIERHFSEADPSAAKAPLPEPGAANNQLQFDSGCIPANSKGVNRSSQSTSSSQSASCGMFTNTVRTALCFEPRDGHLFVFLPPAGYLEHYLALIELIENTAAELNCPIILEGYPPPSDYRIQKLMVTPDPGVIEVNIHPARSFGEMNQRLHQLYDVAHNAKLGTEKFMLDGRHSGTGGGNHVTLGGPTPLDSPFLRRPDLLRSSITYWQHHPSLSYLFSGTFIGPTSQAPRIDEARNDSLYEMEIAFQELSAQAYPQPWWVDRVLRHMLVDLTGNTHRAEFCIDKLYSPDHLSGRQGLVEFRGFEMPPHPKMAMVQVLLLQSLMSYFWETPYHKPLVRWGTLLHDRCLLPHFVWEDIKQVVQDLNDGGLAFSSDWLAPFFEFRFPQYGLTQIQDMTLSLRLAIEPWHVLGEEMGSQGTTRYVDSSVERLEVTLDGLIPGRYLLCCNGRRVPLHATGTVGKYVAGIRYKAWQPPSAKHPSIGIHTPLVFDLIDSWNNKSLGGCTYYVAHPGGCNYQTYPVNAYEAEARRGSRYRSGQQTPGPFHSSGYWYTPPPQRWVESHVRTPTPATLPQEVLRQQQPYTLDLRAFDFPDDNRS